jgi:CheY-like chemotaxis protein
VEVGIVVVLLIVVVAVKGFTSLWLGQLATQIREEESEEVEVLQKLQAMEATKLHLEREMQALERDRKLQENERDLVALDIQKLGAEPLPESSVDEPGVPENREAKPSEGALEPESAASGEEAAHGATGATERGKILVVEDNQELRELLQQILSKNFEVTGAADGYEALTQIVQGKQQFDVVVTDLKMPNVSGIALMQTLPKGVPVIVMSGFLQREEFKNAIRALSPFAVFEKPFKTAALREAIQRATQVASSAAPNADAQGGNEPEGELGETRGTQAEGQEVGDPKDASGL